MGAQPAPPGLGPAPQGLGALLWPPRAAEGTRGALFPEWGPSGEWEGAAHSWIPSGRLGWKILAVRPAFFPWRERSAPAALCSSSTFTARAAICGPAQRKHPHPSCAPRPGGFLSRESPAPSPALTHCAPSRPLLPAAQPPPSPTGRVPAARAGRPCGESAPSYVPLCPPPCPPQLCLQTPQPGRAGRAGGQRQACPEHRVAQSGQQEPSSGHVGL